MAMAGGAKVNEGESGKKMGPQRIFKKSFAF
jgi:hypothetical protein